MCIILIFRHSNCQWHFKLNCIFIRQSIISIDWAYTTVNVMSIITIYRPYVIIDKHMKKAI